MTSLIADSVQAIQDAIGQAPRLLVRGGGTKTALSAPRPDTVELDLRGLSGLLEYEPGEFVFTALAGTPLRAIQAALAQHGQYLPFDPPLAEAGATLGGTVAAGLSGSGRQRYGGVRDFLIGVRFVDGQGQLVRGGGKVVKNAAGFDLPKLMVGSAGRLGVLVEVSFKVFPQPPAFATLQVAPTTLSAALDLIARLTTSSFDIDALDLVFDDAGQPLLLIRQGGLAGVLPQRMANLRTWLGTGEPLPQSAEAEAWRAAGEFAWLPAGWSLVKTPVTLAQIPALEQALESAGARRRYVGGGNLAWLGWPGDRAELDRHLTALNLSGLALIGRPGRTWLGARVGAVMADRIKQTLDPQGKFLDFE